MPDRREAELAVIEAARQVVDRGGTFNMENVPDLWSALHRLDSLPTPAPAGETERVRVAVYRHCEIQRFLTATLADGEDGKKWEDSYQPLVAIITADIPTKPPAIPEIVGTVEESNCARRNGGDNGGE